MTDTKKTTLKNRLNVLGKRAKSLAKVGAVAATFAGSEAKAQDYSLMMAPPQVSYVEQGYSGGYDSPMPGGGYCERPEYFGRGVRGGQRTSRRQCYDGGMQYGGGSMFTGMPITEGYHGKRGGKRIRGGSGDFHGEHGGACGFPSGGRHGSGRIRGGGGSRRQGPGGGRHGFGGGRHGGGGRMIRPRRQGRPF